jgi:hypothetical protein
VRSSARSPGCSMAPRAALRRVVPPGEHRVVRTGPTGDRRVCSRSPTSTTHRCIRCCATASRVCVTLGLLRPHAISFDVRGLPTRATQRWREDGGTLTTWTVRDASDARDRPRARGRDDLRGARSLSRRHEGAPRGSVGVRSGGGRRLDATGARPSAAPRTPDLTLTSVCGLRTTVGGHTRRGRQWRCSCRNVSSCWASASNASAVRSASRRVMLPV